MALIGVKKLSNEKQKTVTFLTHDGFLVMSRHRVPMKLKKKIKSHLNRTAVDWQSKHPLTSPPQEES